MIDHRRRLLRNTFFSKYNVFTDELGNLATDENGNLLYEELQNCVRSVRILSDDDGVDRFYVKYIPKNKTNAPLIIFYHGGGGNCFTFEYQLQLSSSITENYAIAFLSARLNNSPGLGLTAWNSGSVFNNGNLSNLLDVNYTQKAISQISSEHSINPNRIYGGGHSNGAQFIHRAASEAERRNLTHKFAKYIALNGVITHNVQIDSLVVADTGVEPYVYNKPVACFNGSLDDTVPPAGLAGFYITQAASKAIIQATAGVGSIFIDDLVCNHSMDQLDIGFANYTPNTDFLTRMNNFFS